MAICVEIDVRTKARNSTSDGQDAGAQQLSGGGEFRLFLGNFEAAKKLEVLRPAAGQHCITAVVNCAVDLPCTFQIANQQDSMIAVETAVVQPPIEYISLMLEDDSETESLQPALDRALEFLREKAATKQQVFVHCRAGQSRSVAVILAFLIAELGFTFAEAVDRVVAVRPEANPNENYLKQLAELEAFVRGLPPDSPRFHFLKYRAKQLIEMGFDPEQSAHMMRRAGGDLELAIRFLMR